MQIVIPEDGGEAYIQYDDNAYYNQNSSDKGEVPWWAIPGAAFVDAVGAVGNALGLGGDSEYPEGIQGNVSKSFTMSIEEAAELNPDLLKNPAVAEYLGIEDTSVKPQGDTQQSSQQQQQSSQSSQSLQQQQPAQQDKGGGEFIPNQFSDKSDAKISGSLISSLEHGELENVANEIGVDASRLQSAVERVQELEADWKSAEGADAQIAANKKLNKAVKELGALAKSGTGSTDTKGSKDTKGNQVASDVGGYYNKFGEFIPNLRVQPGDEVAGFFGGSPEEKAAKDLKKVISGKAKGTGSYRRALLHARQAAAAEQGLYTATDKQDAESFINKYKVTPQQFLDFIDSGDPKDLHIKEIVCDLLKLEIYHLH